MLSSRPRIVVIGALAAATLACGQPVVRAGVTATAPAAPSATATVRLPLATVGRPADFTLAVEYGVPGLAALYAGTGVQSVKPQIEFGVWGNLEPTPGEYNWQALDQLVAEYQAQGFTHQQLLISADSPWAAIDPRKNPMPRPEYLDEYAAFVGRVVERYDGDGNADAPGLLTGIHDYGIEREFTGFFGGSAAEYTQLLRTAYPVIHAADPQARVLLVGLMMVDVFDGAPDPAEVERRLATTPSYRKSAADIRSILAACDAYDLVDLHSLGHYTEISPTTAWLQAELAAAGCDRPIWIGDSFSMSLLLGFDQHVFAPATAADREAVSAVLQAAADPGSPDHATALAWQQAEEARGLVQKAVVAAGAGLRGINLGNLEDWATHVPAFDKLLVLGMGTAVNMGMAASEVTLERYGRLPYEGDAFARVRLPAAVRPAYSALSLVNEQIGAHSAVRALDLGQGVWAYVFETPAGPVWVLWYDDGHLYLPGQPRPTTTVVLEVGGDQARVTRTPTVTSSSPPLGEMMAAPGGTLNLTLDSTPVFVSRP
ncbi:MAG: hypothetical protein IT317_19355 [Anaerolineales bacterium]|nr:hypothetical protein [Anaerolineales bacterium]